MGNLEGYYMGGLGRAGPKVGSLARECANGCIAIELCTDRDVWRYLAACISMYVYVDAYIDCNGYFKT